MPAPLANADGNANLTVDGNSATGADVTIGVGGGAVGRQNIDVALGKPVIEALADIANAFKIRKASLLDANGRYAYQVRGPDSTVLSMHLTWTQQGVQEGDLVYLEDAP
jgi:hypothetical protein